MHEKFALLYEGGANITIPKYDLQKNPVKAYEMVAMNDVITIPSDTQRDRDLCELGVKDYLLTFDVKEVLSITSREVEIFINDDGEADKKFVERYYFPNVDYVVELQHTNTKIVWLDKGKKPSRFYSVEYKCFPNYIVWDDMTKNRGGEFSDLPKEVRCRLRTYDDPNKPNIAKMKIEYPQAMPSEEGEQQVEEN